MSSFNPFRPLYSFLRDLLVPSSPQLIETIPWTRSTCTVADVLAVQTILCSLNLPPELANLILQHAEYYVCVRTRRTHQLSLSAAGMGAAAAYLESPALGVGGQLDGLPLVKLEKVVFRIVSQDQGWVNDQRTIGTYHGAYSWFDACIWRRSELQNAESEAPSPLESLLYEMGDTASMPSPGTQGFSGNSAVFITSSPKNVREMLLRRGWSFVPRPRPQMAVDTAQDEVTWLIQRNAVAVRDPRTHEVCWTRQDHDDEVEWPEGGSGVGGSFVRSIDLGDRIGVWVRAMVSDFLLLSINANKRFIVSRMAE
jgi:hypothetical protein